MKILFGSKKINLVFLLNYFLFLQVFKYPLMIFIDKFLINLVSILCLVPICLSLFPKRLGSIVRSKIFIIFLILLIHFFISISLLSNNIILAFNSNIQFILPIFFLLILSLLLDKDLRYIVYKSRIIFYILLHRIYHILKLYNYFLLKIF